MTGTRWEVAVYVSPSSVSEGASTVITPDTRFEVKREIYFGRFTDKEILAMCEEGLDLMEKIVEEARKKFK